MIPLQHQRLPSLLIWLCLSGCGSGKGGVPSPEGLRPGGTASSPLRAVTGRFLLGDGKDAAAGLEIWLFDHSVHVVKRLPLDDGGRLDVRADMFALGRSYSMHLVDHFRLVGDLDFAPSVDGVQAEFTSRGGDGFDMGTIIVPVDKRGRSAAPEGIKARIGGGFAVNLAGRGGFGDFSLPDWVASVRAGSQLLVYDPDVLLNSFYTAGSTPRFGRDLRRFSRIGLAVEGAKSGSIGSASIAQAGSWLVAARLPSAEDASPETAGLWNPTGSAALASVDGLIFSASAFAGGIPDGGSVMVVSIQPKASTQPPIAVPTWLPRIVAMPPMVLALSADSSSPTVVDYGNAAARNGLSRPFCLKAGVDLKVIPPLSDEGEVISTGILNLIEVDVDQFSSEGGQDRRESPGSSAYPAPYNASLTATVTGGATAIWAPALGRWLVTLTTPTSDGGVGAADIQLPAELFPLSIGGRSIVKVRLRVKFRSDTEATVGGTVVWLTRAC